jgi:hypothetical protein
MRGLQERIPRIKCDHIISQIADCQVTEVNGEISTVKVIATSVGNHVEIRFC